MVDDQTWSDDQSPVLPSDPELEGEELLSSPEEDLDLYPDDINPEDEDNPEAWS